MVFSSLFSKIFKIREAKCYDAELKGPEEFAEADAEAYEENEHFIPSYRMLGGPVKNVLLETPGVQINGFLFSATTMPSQQFFVTQEVSMAPKKNGRDAGPIPEVYIGGKLPFYTLAAQYHHVDIATAQQKHHFSLIGRIDSHGQVQSIFVKPLGKRANLRVMGAFPNSNPDLAQYETELEAQSGSTKYSFVANSEALETSFVQKLGSRLLIATQLTYLHMTKSISNAFFLRFSRTPSEKYYAQVSEQARAASLSLSSRIDDKTTIVTDFQLMGDNLESSAGLGYRRVNKNFEVVSAIRTNGDMKSLFSYSTQSAIRLKLFLGGNLFHDDFKTGYAISIGGGDE